jgi:tetratricopeptide (TPR) repeat protein
MLAHIAVVAMLVVLVYANSVSNGFVGDDPAFISGNVGIRDIGNTVAFFTGTDHTATSRPEWGGIIYRPLRTLSYAVDYALFKQHPVGYHLHSLLWHAGVCALIYLITVQVTRAPWSALIAAVVFAVHPLHVEAVAWLSSRADLIGSFFALLSLLLYICSRAEEGRRQYALLGFALIAFFVACLGKETMVFLPGLAILYDTSFSTDRPLARTVRERLPAWLAYSIVCAVYLGIRFAVTGRMSTEATWWGGSWHGTALMMVKVTAIYLRLIVAPFELSLRYHIAPVKTLADAGFWISLLVISAYAAATAAAYKRSRVTFFFLCWFPLALVPISNLIPISFSMMAERYIYLPSAGPIVAAAHLLGEALRKWNDAGQQRRLRGAAAVAALAVLVMAACSVRRNRVYRDQTTFYQAALAANPDSAPGLKGMGDQLAQAGDHRQAMDYYRQALANDPAYADAMARLAKSLQRTGDTEGAATWAVAATAYGPDDAKVHFIVADIYLRQRQMAKAQHHWERTVALNPRHGEALNNLGNCHFVAGRQEQALLHYRRSLDANPDNPNAHFNVALILEGSGRADDARGHYQQFIALAGDAPGLRSAVADVKRRLAASTSGGSGDGR